MSVRRWPRTRPARHTGPVDRRFDVVVLGATGITGRRVAAHLGRPGSGARWAAAGRDAARVRAGLAAAGVTADGVLVADAGDTDDTGSLAALAASTAVVLNLAGPYTQRAAPVVAACVAAGTSYADLSGEVPAIARVVERWHAPAREAGVAIVQAAGFEALPPDVAVLLAHEEAARRGTALADVVVGVTITPPPGPMGISEGFSGGTLQSLATVLGDPGPLRLADPALMLPGLPAADAAALRRRSALALRPRAEQGRVLGPTIPAAFINPPVIHRTAALLAQEAGRPSTPFRYREGTDLGSTRSPSAPLRWAAAGATSAGQALVLAGSRLPSAVRRPAAGALARVLPGSGTGPTGPRAEQWRWGLELRATTTDGAVVRVGAQGRGHPGYVTTARMIAELGLLMATGDPARRSGCITPALALGVPGQVLGADALDRLAGAGLVFTPAVYEPA